MSARIQSCYLTAPAGSNLRILTEALRDRGIRVVVPQDPPIADPAREITSLLAGVDLVIGVMTRQRRSDWVLFELGQAWGMGKRVLLFAPPNSAHLPSSLRRFLTIRANLSNREAIEFALDQLLAVPERATGPEPVSPPRPVLGAAADRFRQKCNELSTSRQGLELERLVADALREGGVDVLSTAPGHDQGVDLAIWSDALQPFVGNPLLIEIKSNLHSPSAATDAVQRLARQVITSGSYWGLLLYGEGKPEAVRASVAPNVLLLSLDTLFQRMRSEPFDEIVRDLRNRRVHGGPS